MRYYGRRNNHLLKLVFIIVKHQHTLAIVY